MDWAKIMEEEIDKYLLDCIFESEQCPIEIGKTVVSPVYSEGSYHLVLCTSFKDKHGKFGLRLSSVLQDN